MNITIVGAGNVGTQFAVHCAEKGHDVRIYGSKPNKISKHLNIVNEYGQEIHSGNIVGATNDAKIAFEYADIVFITMPAYCMKDIAEKMLPFTNSNMKVGIIPGTGGGECVFKDCIEKGAIVFGLQRVPSVARLEKYGETVRATGYRDELFVAALPNSAAEECAKIVESIFDMPCRGLPNYLNLTLTPSNPILHTTRLKNLFGDYKEGMVYKNIPLFYEDWNNETSQLLLDCDNEVQEICRKLNQFDLSYVKSLKNHYDSPTAEAMTKKISGIRGFKGLTSPAVEVKGGYVPDFTSRYFTADFPYGLTILVQIADFVGCKVPNMRETLSWYYNLVGISNQEFKFSDYGMRNLQQFIEFYSK